jgi:hypothetical protein
MAISVLALVFAGACGGNGTATEDETTAGETTQLTETEDETTPDNGDGNLTWNDMPIYSGAGQIQEFSMSFSPNTGEYAEYEWRYYECSADAADVIDFYRDAMGDNGWDETMWLDAGDAAYGMYTKNNEDDAALVWIADDGGTTLIGLWRAAK